METIIKYVLCNMFSARFLRAIVKDWDNTEYNKEKCWKIKSNFTFKTDIIMKKKWKNTEKIIDQSTTVIYSKPIIQLFLNQWCQLWQQSDHSELTQRSGAALPVIFHLINSIFKSGS